MVGFVAFRLLTPKLVLQALASRPPQRVSGLRVAWSWATRVSILGHQVRCVFQQRKAGRHIIGGGPQRFLGSRHNCDRHNVLATATQSRPNCVEQHFITKMACEGR
jgi:hypothetical protein